MKKAILFDLDGTLLPMDQETFVKAYFGLLTKVKDYDPKRIVDALWKGTAAMVKNDGSRLNEEVFWDVFYESVKDILTEDINDLKKNYDAFYTTDFHKAKMATGENKLARPLIDHLKEKGYTLILATNPIFPKEAVKARLSWIDLVPEDFAFITSYENMAYCKPNPKYYEDILKKNHLNVEDVIMVGNDIKEDILPTGALGMDHILVSDCLIGDLKDSDAKCVRFEELQKTLDEYEKTSN